MSTKLGGRVLTLAKLGLTAIITIRLPAIISSVNFDGFVRFGKSHQSFLFLVFQEFEKWVSAFADTICRLL